MPALPGGGVGPGGTENAAPGRLSGDALVVAAPSGLAPQGTCHRRAEQCRGSRWGSGIPSSWNTPTFLGAQPSVGVESSLRRALA